MAAEAEHQQEMLIVTGMSGAGRSTVGNASGSPVITRV